MVPILQSPGEPERAGEARRADSASGVKENRCETDSFCPPQVKMHLKEHFGIHPKQTAQV